MRRALLRVFLFVVPLLLWLLGAALFATELGSYQKSWAFLHWFFDAIEPGFIYKDPQIISMYQVTQALRKLAHVVVYAGIAGLTIRLFQQGHHRVRVLPFVMAVVIPGLFLAVEVYIRLHHSEKTRHVRPEQFILDSIGVGVAIVGALIHFGLKAAERWLLGDGKLPPSSRDPDGRGTEPSE